MKMFPYLKSILWIWPDGLVWKITEKLTLKSRKNKFELFMSVMKPMPEDKILDVGISPFVGRSTNFFEHWYPFPEMISAITNDTPECFKDFTKHFPKVTLISGDGKYLNFPDNCFDIVFSNAVVEHVGRTEKQKQFIHEIARVSKRAFITTPNNLFPVDAHTLIPFAHWLPQKIKFWIYNNLGREYYADINHLNLLSAKKFLSLFPEDICVKLYRHKIMGITSSLIAVFEKKDTATM